MKIFVGNLATQTAEMDLMKVFQTYGSVEHVNIAKKGADGLSRGFGFVDVTVESEARSAIAGLNGYTIHGHKIRVSEAQRKSEVI